MAKPRPNEQAVFDPQPLTLEHFRSWASNLVLDNGEKWVLEPFQADFVADELARHGQPAEGWLVVPEGNGKSTLLAGFSLYHCIFVQDAFVPVAAASRDQAKIIYRQAKGFVRRTWGLEDGPFRCYDGYRRIHCRANDSQVEIFAADDRTGDGIIPSLALVDELHRHSSMDLYQTWRGKLDKRQGHILVISTAGEPGGEFEEARERMRQEASDVVRAPGRTIARSESFFLHDHAVAEDGDADDLEQVKAANPFSGITVETLRRKQSSPTMTPQHWRRFVCNLPTRSDRAAIQEKEWFDAVAGSPIPPGEPVWTGLDVAWRHDTTAAVPVWYRDDSYVQLGEASILEPPRDGTSLDPYAVKRALSLIHERNPIHTVVMDMSFAQDIAAWIEAEIGCVVVDQPQNNKFAALEYDTFMRLLRERKLWHSGDRGMTRHALNAVARILPMGDHKFERPAESRAASFQDRRVIDALKAASMCVATAAAQQPDNVWLY